MSKPRSGTSYRPSAETQDLLGRLADRLGLTRTGVLEMAIRKLAEETMSDSSPSEAERMRRLCHSLIDHLSDAGLPEAVETLSDMVQFYENPPLPYQRLPQGEPVAAQWGETHTRPVYPVTEEE